MPTPSDFDPGMDYYAILGVPASATAEEIRRAYLRQARLSHPDMTRGDKAQEARFRQASSAYEVLSDDDRRRRYDGSRALGGAPFMGQGAREAVDFFSQFDQVLGAFRDVFSDPADRRSAGSPPGDRSWRAAPAVACDGSPLIVDGIDVSSSLRIPFDRAILGTWSTIATIDGMVQVRIPPGTSSGQQLRLRGRGATDPWGDRGDHYVIVHIDVPSDLDDLDRASLSRLVERLRRSS